MKDPLSTATLDGGSDSMVALTVAYFRTRPLRVAVLLALTLILAGLAVVPPVILSRIVDDAIENRATLQGAALAIGAITLLAVADALLTYARRRFAISTEIGIRGEASAEHFSTSTRLPLPAYGSGNEAALIRSFDDLDSVIEFAAGHSVDLLAQAFILSSYVTLMFVVDWRMAIVVLALAGLGLAHSAVQARGVERAVDEWLPARDKRFGFIVECLTSMLTIKTLSIHSNLRAPFRREQDVEQAALAKFRVRRVAADATNRFWSIATPGIGAAFGVVLLIQKQLSAGDLVLFLTVSAGVTAAVSAVHQGLQDLHRARASLQRMRTLTRASTEDLNDGVGASQSAIAEIGAKRLTYYHPDTVKPTLADLSLSIRRGEHVAIVGRSGEGKTTLAHVLARLLESTDGGIVTESAQPLSLDEHRRAVLLVPHVIAVFSASLRENVRLWDEAVSDRMVCEALRLAGLEEFTRSYASGLDTMLGASGNPLSAGQQQRLGLARVFLRRPEVLILDEATSAMDTETEGVILSNVRHFMNDRTLIVITHRNAVAEAFSRTYRVEAGRIVITHSEATA